MTSPSGSSALASSVSPAIEARELYRFYHVGDDETLALRGVSMDVKAGEIVVQRGEAIDVEEQHRRPRVPREHLCE